MHAIGLCDSRSRHCERCSLGAMPTFWGFHCLHPRPRITTTKVLHTAFRCNVSNGGVLARRASFFDYSPPVPVFAPTSPTIWSTFSPCLRIWPIFCTQFMMMARVVVGSGGSDILFLNSLIFAYARCLAGKVCGLVKSTWGTSLGEDKLGARDTIPTKVARRACAGCVPGKHFPNIHWFPLNPLLLYSLYSQLCALYYFFVCLSFLLHPP